jgi:type 1 fimbria pilin
MNKRVLLAAVLWLMLIFTPRIAFAFYCDGGWPRIYTTPAASIPVTPTDAPYISPLWSALCTGVPEYREWDALKINNLQLSPEFVRAGGYVLEMSVGGGSGWGTWRGGHQIWPYYNLDRTSSTASVRIRLRRTISTPFTTIPAGTNIAYIDIDQRSLGVWGCGWCARLSYNVSGGGDVVPISRTCNVASFDHPVTLPEIRHADLARFGPGRYSGVTKAFNINLQCEHTPEVSVVFEGTKMPGVASEDVLANQSTGNDNVGIQLLFNNTPLKIGSAVAGSKVKVLNAAGANEALKFNAYYYYKGGPVQPGPVQSQSEFLFSYQ